MIKFFRQIRQNLLLEGKTRKYLKYAVGEIILVVIGILIALQINSWYARYKLDQKEETYLIEIQNNLLIDRGSVQSSISVNNHKLAVIDSMMILLSTADNSHDYMGYLANNQAPLSSFPTFEPLRVAFDNMVSSHSIDLIQNEQLRIALSNYYNYNWERSPQSASRSRTRIFANILMEKLIDYPLYHRNLKKNLGSMVNANNKFRYNDNFRLKINDPNYLEFHKDRKALAAMFVMMPTSVYQSKWIENAGKNIEVLLDLIGNELASNK